MKETFLFLHMKAIYLDALPPRDQSSGEQLYESNKLTSPSLLSASALLPCRKEPRDVPNGMSQRLTA
jgi:hypothetical protein